MTKLLLILFLACFQLSSAQQPYPLYPGQVPNELASNVHEYARSNDVVDSLTYDVTNPSVAFYPRQVNRGSKKSIIIIPGGGYQVLLTRREGSFVAQRFNQLGYSCFVLKYRLPDDAHMRNKSFVPLQDLQQAIKTIRENAGQWDIHPDSIGIMGFSAGGHLAATGVTHFDTSFIENKRNTSLRPAFAILVNPVISFTGTFGHRGSAEKLLGPGYSPALADYFSAEKNIKDSTPPCLLIHSNEDVVVPVANSISFFLALRAKQISAAIHIYARGEHGLLSAPSFNEWFHECIYWIESEIGPHKQQIK